MTFREAQELVSQYDQIWWDIADSCNYTEVGLDAVDDKLRKRLKRIKDQLIKALVNE